jgi:hypothetical protein
MALLTDIFSGPNILVYGVSELFLDAVPASEIAARYGISKKLVEIIVSMSPQDVPLFAQIADARGAVKLTVNFELAADVAEEVAKWRADQHRRLNERFERWYKAQSYSSAAVTAFKYKQFIDHLISVLAELHSERSPKTIELPPRLVAAIHDLSNGVWPLYKKALMLAQVIELHCDEKALDLSIAAFNARVAQQKIVTDLIRAGADWPFIQKYNGIVSVDSKHYRAVRQRLGVADNKEKISVAKGSDVMSDFNRLMSTGMETIDVYFNLRRKHGFRIETLYRYIQEVLAEQDCSDDDEDDLDFATALD